MEGPVFRHPGRTEICGPEPLPTRPSHPNHAATRHISGPVVVVVVVLVLVLVVVVVVAGGGGGGGGGGKVCLWGLTRKYTSYTTPKPY